MYSINIGIILWAHTIKTVATCRRP